MNNPHRGEVTFVVAGKTYTMRGSIDAICALEAISGKGMVTITRELSDPETMTMTLTRQVLWALLQERQPGITLQEAGDLIPAAGGMAGITKAIGEAFQAMFPDVAKGDEAAQADPPQAGQSANGTGPHSTPSGQVSAATPTTSGSEPRAN